MGFPKQQVRYPGPGRISALLRAIRLRDPIAPSSSPEPPLLPHPLRNYLLVFTAIFILYKSSFYRSDISLEKFLKGFSRERNQV